MKTADDMGLGKTLEMISLVLAMKNEKRMQAASEGRSIESDDDDDEWSVQTNSRQSAYNNLFQNFC